MPEFDVIARIGELSGAAIVDALQREYPNAPRHVMRDDADRPLPREIHPAFYGCFDWHSAVEMHWALALLVRLVPEGEFVPAARDVLARHLTRENLATEAAYFIDNPSFERPYGWGWALALADALADWAAAGDDDAAGWSAAMQPLAEAIEAGFLAWLPRPAYPDRTGMHSNTAFALARALPYGWRRARDAEPALRDAIGDAAVRWYGDDEEYSAAFEPSGADFLSPTLTEIELMMMLLTEESFGEWYYRFVDASLPVNLAHPAHVTDDQDGQGAHLHGLNLYRLRVLRLLRAREEDESEVALLDEALHRHIEAAGQALGAKGWMSEHWLAAYGVLALV